MNKLYLLVNLGAFIVPFLFSFHPRLLFYKQWKYAIPAILVAALPFIVWDVFFTKLGVWGFNPDYLIGTYFLNLPFEEILFFIAIPYCCLFTHHCFIVLISKDYFKNIENAFTSVFALFLIVMAFLFQDKWYTGYTFSLLSIFLVFCKWVMKVKWLSRFYFSYTILLIPFLIVNGILTGTGLEEPVVWYNNNENLGIRILTIPVEDVFYGMLLIMLNVFLMEQFKKNHLTANP